jgi:hydrogenase nickel incorporation protein HypB
VYVVSLVSSPGAGKTEFLEKTLGRLVDSGLRVAALVGDLATDNDARRLARSRAPVRQITTGTVCHLDAEMVEAALDGWDLDALDLLFIENVGNLVCPSSYDLGEDLRLVLFSVTEGEDKPLKYPTIFNTADVAIITKIDLAEAVGFDAEAAYRSIQAVRPGMLVLEVSARDNQSMSAWLDELRARRSSALADPSVVFAPTQRTEE